MPASIPIVSVVMPTFCVVQDIACAIDSIMSQTFQDWELLIINDFGSDDGTAQIVQEYSDKDIRIKLIQATTRLGLARSLNLGIQKARGKYIARMDADDIAYPERLEMQVMFMENNEDVGICGTWQLHYTQDSMWVHKSADNSELLKCRLLFYCDLCHSTVMMRREMLIKFGLYYDPSAVAEDYELWTRAVNYVKIVNLPIVMGSYKENYGITVQKKEKLAEESGKIAARSLKELFKIELSSEDSQLLNVWINPLQNEPLRKEKLSRLRIILTEIYERNNFKKKFDCNLLLQTLAAKWHWVKDNIDYQVAHYESVKTIDDVFEEQSLFTKYKLRYQIFKYYNPTWVSRIKKIMYRIGFSSSLWNHKRK